MLGLLTTPRRRPRIVDRAETGAEPDVLRRRFRSMGMDIVLTGPDDGERRVFDLAGDAVERTFREVDARFSRFRPDSELSRVNANAGRWQMVSAQFAHVLQTSLDAARATGGLFDPTVLPALVAAGYDRDYDEVRDSPGPAFEPGVPHRWRQVELDERMLYLREGAALDFGGIAKGWAVDQALARTTGLPWALIDAGGDMALGGLPPAALQIGVADPNDPASELARLALDAGALATSSVVGRSWGPGLHHVIDPRTWLPARTDLLQATVWAPTCTEAEVLATWTLLRGPRALREVPGIVVTNDDRVLTSMPGSEVQGAC